MVNIQTEVPGQDQSDSHAFPLHQADSTTNERTAPLINGLLKATTNLVQQHLRGVPAIENPLRQSDFTYPHKDSEAMKQLESANHIEIVFPISSEEPKERTFQITVDKESDNDGRETVRMRISRDDVDGGQVQRRDVVIGMDGKVGGNQEGDVVPFMEQAMNFMLNTNHKPSRMVFRTRDGYLYRSDGMLDTHGQDVSSSIIPDKIELQDEPQRPDEIDPIDQKLLDSQIDILLRLNNNNLGDGLSKYINNIRNSVIEAAVANGIIETPHGGTVIMEIKRRIPLSSELQGILEQTNTVLGPGEDGKTYGLMFGSDDVIYFTGFGKGNGAKENKSTGPVTIPTLNYRSIGILPSGNMFVASIPWKTDEHGNNIDGTFYGPISPESVKDIAKLILLNNNAENIRIESIDGDSYLNKK